MRSLETQSAHLAVSQLVRSNIGQLAQDHRNPLLPIKITPYQLAELLDRQEILRLLSPTLKTSLTHSPQDLQTFRDIGRNGSLRMKIEKIQG